MLLQEKFFSLLQGNLMKLEITKKLAYRNLQFTG